MQRRVKAVFVRGGTSKALVFRPEDVPPPGAGRDALILEALGSPDPYGRQLDGLGGGISSLSKVAIVGPSSDGAHDVDYTFGQVEVATASVDYRGNCGNISSAIGPFAIDEGLVAPPAGGSGEAAVRILNTNTGKTIVSRFAVRDGEAEVEGDFELAGVPGTGARIRLEFLDPGGSVTGSLLPTGRARDVVGGVEASLVDATNPMVFVRASDLGVTRLDAPDLIDADAALGARLEAIRAAASAAMGLATLSQAVPKIALVAPPDGEDADVRAAVISMGRCHRAFALTGGMCLAVAAHIPGSLVADACRPLAPGADVRLRHPAGVLPLAATVEQTPDGPRADRVVVYRTARRLMEGYIRIRR